MAFVTDYDRHRDYLLHWLDGLRPKGFDQAGILVAEIQLRKWGWYWEEASPALFDLLDHTSNDVRAHAAGALGVLFDTLAPEEAPLTETFEVIKARELARPGIAAPFWCGVQSRMWIFEGRPPGDA